MHFTFYRKLRERDVSKFHIQLCIVLFCMLIVFVSGIDQTHVYRGCVTVAVLIHYFTLVAWMWMGAEAVLVFQKLVIDSLCFLISLPDTLLLFAGVSKLTPRFWKTVSNKFFTSLSLQCSLLSLWSFHWLIDSDLMVTFSPPIINNTISTTGISNTTNMDSIR